MKADDQMDYGGNETRTDPFKAGLNGLKNPLAGHFLAKFLIFSGFLRFWPWGNRATPWGNPVTPRGRGVTPWVIPATPRRHGVTPGTILTTPRWHGNPPRWRGNPPWGRGVTPREIPATPREISVSPRGHGNFPWGGGIPRRQFSSLTTLTPALSPRRGRIIRRWLETLRDGAGRIVPIKPESVLGCPLS